MSQTSDPVDFDDLPENETEEEQNDSGYLDLEAGDEIGGRIKSYYPNRGYNGEVVLEDGRHISLNQGMARELAQSLVDGASLGIRVGTEEQSFTNSDGEEITYCEKELRAAHMED